MKANVSIDSALCKNCRTCTEICPNVIFIAEDHTTKVRPERISLCFACGQCMAACREKAISVEGLDYDRDFFELPESVNSFNALIQTRRSIRSFKDIPVPKEILEQVVDAITYAPLSFPPLKTEITVIQDKKLIEAALPLMVKFFDELLTVLKKPVIGYILKKRIGQEKYRQIKNHITPIFNLKLPFIKKGTEDAITRNAHAMILFHADSQSDNYENDIFIAVAYALLRAHSLGLGATAINLIPPAVERSSQLRQMFKIPEGNRVVASIIFGYPKHTYRRAIKRQLKSITWL